MPHTIVPLAEYAQGKGDRKVVPNVSVNTLRKIASITPETTAALEKIIEPMLSVPPFSLGFSDENNQSNYYPGEERITREEAATIAKVMEQHSIEPENTRVRKIMNGTQPAFEILQASAEITDTKILDADGFEATVSIKRGDHVAEMSMICSALKEAIVYAASDKQISLLHDYIESFSTGSLEAYRRSQKTWVTDISPRVENILGFVEQYRDPYGVRAEWEGAVCISDPFETSRLKSLVDNSTAFIRLLPWAVHGENDGKGPFEASRFQAPDFTIVHCK